MRQKPYRVVILAALILTTLAMGCLFQVPAQQAGRPRRVDTKPPEPCNERDFIQAADTDVASLCQDGHWKPIVTGTPGTVTSVSVTTANGVSGSVATATTTPAITLTLGAITPSSEAVSGNSTVTGLENGCIDAGANDTYACNPSPVVGSYVTGAHYRFKANTANTGAATINVNSKGALTIVKMAGGITTALADNDIRAGQWVDCTYDGTNCQMTSQMGNGSAAVGDVVGPAGATDSHLAVFDGGTGKLIKDGSSLIVEASGAIRLPRANAPFTFDVLGGGSTQAQLATFGTSEDGGVRAAIYYDAFLLGNGLNTGIGRVGSDTLGIICSAGQALCDGKARDFTLDGQKNLTAVATDSNGKLVAATKSLTANSVTLTAQSTSIGATNLSVNGGVAPAGLYRLSYYLVTTTAGTSGTVSATFGWTDIATARTFGTGNITFGTLATPATGTVIIQADGIANITYLTTVTAAVGSPVYALNITLEKLQ